MKNSNNSSAAKEHTIKYYTIRKISFLKDSGGDWEGEGCPPPLVYTGYLSAEEILGIGTEENVRGYYQSRQQKKKTKTKVHKAVLETLNDCPHRFPFLNGGVTLVAESIEVNDQEKSATLRGASIINGAQTQGMLKDFKKEEEKEGRSVSLPAIKFEIIVTKGNLVGEISVARNFQEKVDDISIAGALKELDKLGEDFEKQTGRSISTSETDPTGDGDEACVDTYRLLRVIALLMPDEYMETVGKTSKNYAYNAKQPCLKVFRDIREKAKAGDSKAHEVYRFYLNTCGEAWKLYEYWKSHPFYDSKNRLKEDKRSYKLQNAVSKRKGKDIVAHEGFIAPIMAALSVFLEKEEDKWTFKWLEKEEDKQEFELGLIRRANEVLTRQAKSQPSSMGKMEGCYETLKEYCGKQKAEEDKQKAEEELRQVKAQLKEARQ